MKLKKILQKKKKYSCFNSKMNCQYRTEWFVIIFCSTQLLHKHKILL